MNITLNRTTAGSKGELGSGLLLACLFIAAFIGAVTALFGGVVSALFVLVILASAVALVNYRVGLWFLVLLLPLSVTTIFPRQMFGITGANPYNALFALTLLSFLGAHVLKRKKEDGPLAYPRLWWAYILPIVLAALIGTRHVGEIPAFAFTNELVRFTTAGGYLRDALIKPLTTVFLALLLGVAVRKGMKPSSIIVAMCLSIWLLAAWVFFYLLYSGVGLSQLASSSARGVLTRTGLHANGLGTLAGVTLTLMVYAIANSDKNSGLRWLYITTAGFSSALLVLSFSRAGFVAFLVGLSIFFIRQRRLKIVVIGLFALAFILPLLPTELYERLATGMDTGGSMVMYSSNDPLTAGRVAGVWQPLLPEVRAHPLFGNGLLSVAWSQAFRSGALVMETLNPHSMYLKILLEVGLVGLLLLVLFFHDLLRRFRNAAKDPATPRQLVWLFDGAAAALIGYAASGISGGDYLPSPTTAFLWIAFGLLLAVPAGLLPTGKGKRSQAAGLAKRIGAAGN